MWQKQNMSCYYLEILPIVCALGVPAYRWDSSLVSRNDLIEKSFYPATASTESNAVFRSVKERHSGSLHPLGTSLSCGTVCTYVVDRTEYVIVLAKWVLWEFPIPVEGELLFFLLAWTLTKLSTSSGSIQKASFSASAPCGPWGFQKALRVIASLH